jgi:hypothetical protein
MRIFAAAVLLCLASFGAEAKQSPYPVTPFEGDRYGARTAQMGADVAKAVKVQRTRKAARSHRWRRVPVPRARPELRQVPIFAPYVSPGAVEPLTLYGGAKREAGRVAQTIGGRPSGCPHRFCGCALALKIFGRIVPTLNLAVNWVHKFQRSPPAPGMVAARHGHAFQLIAHVRGTTWRVWDANSGRGRIRVHERSIAGFVIVNPHGSSS